jgi:hypothetical protein
MFGRVSAYSVRRGVTAALILLAILMVGVLRTTSHAQAAQAKKAQPCAVLRPTVQPESVAAALHNKYSTVKPAANFRIASVQEHNTKAASGQCVFTATLVPAHGRAVHKTIWVVSPFSALTKKFPHPNLVLPGLFGNEIGDTLDGAIAGYGGFNATSKAGHPTATEAAELDALALRWAIPHRVQVSPTTSTTS